MKLRDIEKELNIFGINEDWQEKSLVEFLEFNGYKVADTETEFVDREYSDIKGYLDLEIEVS